MSVVRTIMEWVPGALKLGTSDSLPDTSIVFPEEVIHPGITNPNVLVPLAEEEMLIFLHSLLQALYRSQSSIPEVDIPDGFSIRRVFSLDLVPDKGIIRWSVDVPVETALLFGLRQV